jgi:cell division protein FtsQ
MKKWQKWTVLGILLFIAVTVFAVIRVQRSSDEVKDFKLVVDEYYQTDQFFIDEEILKQRLQRVGLTEIKGKTVDQIDLLALEQELEKIEYVADARAYFTMSQELVVEVTQRVPVLRVFNRVGQSYYLDQSGKMMETSQYFSAYCMVATGNIGTYYKPEGTDTGFLRQMAQMSYELGKKDNTSGLFTQISVQDEHSIWLISRIEGFPCRVDLYQPIIPQIEKWLAFVASADSTGAWKNTYESVDLRFSNQIIAHQRGKKIQFGMSPPVPKTDTLVQNHPLTDTPPVQAEPETKKADKAKSEKKKDNPEKKKITSNKKSEKSSNKKKESKKESKAKPQNKKTDSSKKKKSPEKKKNKDKKKDAKESKKKDNKTKKDKTKK